MTNVHVAGVGMTPFSKALDSTLSGLASVAVDQALKDSTLTADRVGMVFFGNAMGGTMTGQEMIRAKGRGPDRLRGAGHADGCRRERLCFLIDGSALGIDGSGQRAGGHCLGSWRGEDDLAGQDPRLQGLGLGR